MVMRRPAHQVTGVDLEAVVHRLDCSFEAAAQLEAAAAAALRLSRWPSRQLLCILPQGLQPLG